ncbi:hypothetical protein BD310DRAFT_940502 [Dichomitus squalens]|uniref:Uncharacterized protein n=1 Tax=Dichomitus squalens TaxID=114155 RepID=A0A4Q9PC61_9APHY|nr:hypothetical protein BD310DRAFT_940502 [Dichomitus squalens]
MTSMQTNGVKRGRTLPVHNACSQAYGKEVEWSWHWYWCLRAQRHTRCHTSATPRKMVQF